MSEIAEIERPHGLEDSTENHLEDSEITETLKPRSYVDSDGTERQIYTLKSKDGKPVEVVFYSPEEIPFNGDVVSDKHVMILGEQPKWRSKKEWDTFGHNIATESLGGVNSPSMSHQTERVLEGNGLIFAESNPTAILDLAMILTGDSSKEDQNDRRNAHLKIITPRAQEMMDKIIACKLYDSNGKRRNASSYEGEVLTLLALAGNNEAQEILDRSYELMQKQDAETEAELQDQIAEMGERNKDSEDMKIEDLVAVHATRYLPKTISGTPTIRTTFDATGWEVPRDTVHFSLNHHVAGHMYGSWDGAPYVVISSLGDMMETNGKPASLNTVDTYFEATPGTGVKLPESTWIAKPGILAEGEIVAFDDEKQELVYKNERINAADIAKLYESLGYDEKQWFEWTVLDRLTADLSQYEEWWRIHVTQEQSDRVYEYRKAEGSGQETTLAFVELGVDEAVRKICEEKFGVVLSDKDFATLCNTMRSYFASKIKTFAINSQITRMGYKPEHGGMWAWGDSWDVTGSTAKLGGEIGVPVMAHSGTINSDMESYVPSEFRRMNAEPRADDDGYAPVKPKDPREVKEDVKTTVREKADKISPQLRRALYLMGAL